MIEQELNNPPKLVPKWVTLKLYTVFSGYTKVHSILNSSWKNMLVLALSLCLSKIKILYNNLMSIKTLTQGYTPKAHNLLFSGKRLWHLIPSQPFPYLYLLFTCIQSNQILPWVKHTAMDKNTLPWVKCIVQ